MLLYSRVVCSLFNLNAFDMAQLKAPVSVHPAVLCYCCANTGIKISSKV